MKYKAGDMLVSIDMPKRKAVFFKIASIEEDSYKILCHDGTSWNIDDEGIWKNNFKKFWDNEMDEQVKSLVGENHEV